MSDDAFLQRMERRAELLHDAALADTVKLARNYAARMYNAEIDASNAREARDQTYRKLEEVRKELETLRAYRDTVEGALV